VILFLDPIFFLIITYPTSPRISLVFTVSFCLISPCSTSKNGEIVRSNVITGGSNPGTSTLCVCVYDGFVISSIYKKIYYISSYYYKQKFIFYIHLINDVSDLYYRSRPHISFNELI